MCMKKEFTGFQEKNEYKDPNMLPKVNEVDVTGMMEAMKEYLRSSCGVKKAPSLILSKRW